MKETVETLKLKDEKLSEMNEKLTVALEDNEYLRTENQKVKNAIKQIKENYGYQTSKESNVSKSSEIDEDSECCTNISKQLNNLHQEFIFFRKFM